MNKTYTTAEKRHMELIKSMPCCVCGQPAPSYAHHIRQGSAYYCIPLCYSCHQCEHNGIHGRKAMWKINKLDELDALALTVRRLVER